MNGKNLRISNVHTYRHYLQLSPCQRVTKQGTAGLEEYSAIALLPFPLQKPKLRVASLQLQQHMPIHVISSLPHKFVTVDQSCCVARTVVKAHGAGKAIPLQAWPGPEGSRKLGFPDEGGKVSPTHRPAFAPRYIPGTHAPAAFSPKIYSWYSFLLEVESTPRLQCGRKDEVNEKFQ
jgi:hypothetical protein